MPLTEQYFLHLFISVSKKYNKNRKPLSSLCSSAIWPKSFVFTHFTPCFKYTQTKITVQKKTLHQSFSSSRKKDSAPIQSK